MLAFSTISDTRVADAIRIMLSVLAPIRSVLRSAINLVIAIITLPLRILRRLL
jgi:phage-related protein